MKKRQEEEKVFADSNYEHIPSMCISLLNVLSFGA